MKNPVKRMRRQIIEGKNIFQTTQPIKGLISRLYKKPSKVNIKRNTKSNEKMSPDTNRYLIKEEI